MIPITPENLLNLAPTASKQIVYGLGSQLSAILATYGITTQLRICHFLAQAAHETAGFKTLVEYGDATYFNKRYGSQTSVGKRLSNTQPGDGARFRGRGIFQCTGRSNYAFYGKKIGVDLIKNPELAADPINSIKIACEYWKAKGLNALADADNIEGITRKINGGLNGLTDRKAYLAKAKAIWRDTKTAVPPAPPAPIEDVVPDAPIATEAPASLGESKTIWGTITAVVGSGAASLLAYIQNPYALAAFAIVVVAGAAIIFLRMKQRKDFGT